MRLDSQFGHVNLCQRQHDHLIMKHVCYNPRGSHFYEDHLPLVKQVLMKGKVVKRGDKTYVLSLCFDRVLGMSNQGRKCRAVRVVLNCSNKVVSAFPHVK